MGKETEMNLQMSFASESMAHMRYLTWGRKARNDGFENIARLFDAVAFAERVHATHFFAVIQNREGDAMIPAFSSLGIGSTENNISTAINGEKYETDERYPAYLQIAKMQGMDSAVWAFTYAAAAEKTHEELFSKARAAVAEGRDVELAAINVCITCGFTTEIGTPDRCPVCGADAEKFKSF